MGKKQKLLPVRVRACQPEGLLRTIIYSDLVGKDEPAAREKLLADVRPGRAKPPTRPPFPAKPKPSFPGSQSKTIKKVSQAPIQKKNLSMPVQKKNYWYSWRVIGVIIALVFGAWAISSVVSNINSSEIYDSTPAYHLDQFCNAMQSHQWDSAYTCFDASLQTKVSQSQFIASINMVADKHDHLANCTYHVIKQIGSITHANITFTFGDGMSETKQYDLFQDPLYGWSLDVWTF